MKIAVITLIAIATCIVNPLEAKSAKPKAGSAFHGDDVPSWNVFAGGWQWSEWEAKKKAEFMANPVSVAPSLKANPSSIEVRVNDLEHYMKGIMWMANGGGLNISGSMHKFERSEQAQAECTLDNFVEQLDKELYNAHGYKPGTPGHPTRPDGRPEKNDWLIHAHKPNTPGKPIRPDGMPPEKNEWYMS